MNKYAEHSKQGQARQVLYGKIYQPGFATCLKKRVHEDEQSAMKFLAENGHPGQPYRCPHCYRWHITTKGVFSGL